MSSPAPLPLRAGDVRRQFARRGELADARFFYDEIATRMDQRLGYIRLAPQSLLDAGCGTGANLPALRARYPQAGYTGLDHCAPLLDIARRKHAASGPLGWLKQLGKRKPPVQFVQADLARTELPAESLDLVWSSLALHWHPEPHAVLAEWRRVLRVDGLAMFSWLGPGTLKELRQALADAKLATATPAFVDMHDFGDLLVESGFADPVMDQETITLTYRDPVKLLADVRALGGNPAAARRPGLASRAWRQRLLDALEAQRNADGLIVLSMEVSYGHAWRAAARRSAPHETTLSVSAIKRAARP